MQKEKGDCIEAKRRSYSILTQDDINSGRKPCRTGIEVVGLVRNLSPKLWCMDNLMSLYMTDCSITRLPPEICNLTKLQYLDLSRNKLRSLPSELGDMIELRELLLSNNGLRVIPNELGRLFQLRVLGLDGNPLPSEILSMADDSANINKLLGKMLENLTVCPRPPERNWISLVEDAGKTSVNDTFTVMSFNVLCDKYCTLQQYGYCPAWALQWDKRKTDVLKDIVHYSADIIALQEVETEQFNSFFLPELRQNGYEGIFSPKSRAKTMLEEERRHVDGCAIFWNTSKFHCLKEHLVEFNQLAAAHAEGADDMLNRVMIRDNIGIMAFLETVPEFGPKRHVVVANAHIHWDPEYRDVKLIQTVMLMNEAERFFEEVMTSQGEKNGFSPQYDKIPFVMCSDLNSLPDSGVLEFLESAKISTNHDDFQQLAYDGFFSRCAVSSENGKTTDELLHPFRLCRSYKNVDMPFTNFTYDFTGVLDYIFYTSNNLSCLGALGPVDQQYISKNKVLGFPHPHFPSDHISLVVELAFNCDVRNGSLSSDVSFPR